MKNKYSKKTVILALLLVIVVLMIFAAFCRPLMRLLGFEYAGIGDFFLFFVLSSFVSWPLNTIFDAIPVALVSLKRLSVKAASVIYVISDTATTFLGFCIVDYFMDRVSASELSIFVIALIFALSGVSDAINGERLK